MTGVEIILLLIGAVFMIGSFFVAEKLSPSELNQIARLSENELNNIIGKGLDQAKTKIEDAIETQIDESMDKTDRALEKVTNEKIMAISEYSDTVIGSMNKVHNEIMFLYNMLNDKHTELTGMASDLQKLAADVRNAQENMKQMQQTAAPVGAAATAEKPMAAQKPAVQRVNQLNQSVAAPKEPAQAQMADHAAPKEARSVAEGPKQEKENHNEEILALHKQGMSDIDIARKTKLGLGEVKLVIGLYKGEADS